MWSKIIIVTFSNSLFLVLVNIWQSKLSKSSLLEFWKGWNCTFDQLCGTSLWYWSHIAWSSTPQNEATWGQLLNLRIFPLRNSQWWRQLQPDYVVTGNFSWKKGLIGDRTRASRVAGHYAYPYTKLLAYRSWPKITNFVINWQKFANFCKLLQNIAN